MVALLFTFHVSTRNNDRSVAGLIPPVNKGACVSGVIGEAICSSEHDHSL
jgi:hypothetical protein